MQIYGNAKEAFSAAHERAFGAALTLILLAFLFTVAARIVSSRLSRSRGS
jgi:phosphate transport system permease protein